GLPRIRRRLGQGEHLLRRRPVPVLGRPRLVERGQDSADASRADRRGEEALYAGARPPGRVRNGGTERRGHRLSPLRKRDISLTATVEATGRCSGDIRERWATG